MFTFVLYEDVFGEKPYTIDEITKYFSTLHTGHLIQALCKLNIAIWKSHEDFTIHNDLLKVFFNDKELLQIQKFRLKNKKLKPFVFHRQQLLIAIKLALLYPNNQGQRTIGNRELGKYIMSISDYLDKNNQPPSYCDLLKSVNFEFIRRQMARLGYFSHTENFLYSYTRALHMWLDIPVTSRGKAMLKKFNIDPHKEFLEAVGLTIDEYLEISIMYTLKLFQLDARTQDPKDYMLYWDYFKNTILPQGKKDILFSLLSQNIENYAFNNQEAIQDKLNGTDYFEYNFLPIVENPIININADMAIIADPSYAIEKTTHGVYWILHNTFKREADQHIKKRKLFALSNYYGILHQEYVYSVLLSLCDKVIEIPEKQGDKRADYACFIRDGEKLIVIIAEAKKLALPLPMVYDSTRKQTIQKLKEVFFDDGFRQVFNTIRLIQQGKLAELGIDSIDPNKIKIVYPLLILDTFIVEESLNRKFYEEEFLDKLHEEIPLTGNIPITHPIILCSDDLDIIETIVKSDNIGAPINLANLLLFRNEQLNKRSHIEQWQFIPNMFILGKYNIPVDLDTFWNNLCLLPHENLKNTRLQNIFKRHTDNAKRLLFGKRKG